MLNQSGINNKQSDDSYAATKIGIPAASGIEPVLPPAGPSGGFNAPSGVYNQPSGAYSQPSGAYNAPSGIYNQPSGMYTQPSGAFGMPSGIMGTVGDEGSVSMVMRFGTLEDSEISQNYDVGEQLGRGASAIVYEAWRKTDRMHCVIKVMQIVGYDDDEAHVAIKRFYREAELISSLHEEHIVQCLDYGRFEGTPCMVLEFVEGLSLDKLISQYGALPLQYATGIIDQLLQALIETHSKSIIHRDIKPGNIMVFDSPPPYVIRVLDFGISSVLDGLQSQTLMTQAGNVRGTPSYMAPELFTGETRASVESDLYAVGLVYLECLTGQVAVSDKSFMRVAYKQVNEQLEIPGFIPQSIADIILKMCAKPINQRYHSAATALEDIRAKLPKALKEEEKCAKEWASSGGKVVRKSRDANSISLTTNQGFSLSNPKVLIVAVVAVVLIGLFLIFGVVLSEEDEQTDPKAPVALIQTNNNQDADNDKPEDDEQSTEQKEREKAITEGILIINTAWSNADFAVSRLNDTEEPPEKPSSKKDKNKGHHHPSSGSNKGDGQKRDNMPNFFEGVIP